MKRSSLLILFFLLCMKSFAVICPIPMHIHYGDCIFLDSYKDGEVQIAEMTDLSGYIDIKTNTLIRNTGSNAVVYFQKYIAQYKYEGCGHIVTVNSRIHIFDTPVPANIATSFIMHKKDNFFRHFDDDTGVMVYDKNTIIEVILFPILLYIILWLAYKTSESVPENVVVEHGDLDIKYDDKGNIKK